MGLCGGADGECLTDLECALDHLGVPYTRHIEAIYSPASGFVPWTGYEEDEDDGGSE